MYRALRRITFSLLIVVLTTNCSLPRETKELAQEYTPATRQLPLEPVYSRVTWSHLPKPIGLQYKGKAPYLQKIFYFDLANSSLEESLSALAQAIGYEAKYPRELAHKKISLVTEGTIEDILDKICLQAETKAEIDHQQRIIRIFPMETKPSL